MNLNQLLMYCVKPVRKWQTKKKNCLKSKLSSLSIITMVILASLPYSSALSLPSGDPAPGRSPGPPKESNLKDKNIIDDGIEKVTNIAPEEVYDDTTTIDEVEVTTVSDVSVETGDACAFARIPSDSDAVVTLSSVNSDVNLTVSHPVFETDELVRGVVYDGARLGIMEVMAGVAAILQKFSVEPAACSKRVPDPDPAALITEAFVGGLPLKFKRRVLT